MSVVEDAGGYFCSVCGNHEHPHECDELVGEGELDWSVFIQTLKDSLEQEEKAGEQLCTYNKETRERAMKTLLLWRKQSFRRERLRSYYYSAYRNQF